MFLTVQGRIWKGGVARMLCLLLLFSSVTPAFASCMGLSVSLGADGCPMVQTVGMNSGGNCQCCCALKAKPSAQKDQTRQTNNPEIPTLSNPSGSSLPALPCVMGSQSADQNALYQFRGTINGLCLNWAVLQNDTLRPHLAVSVSSPRRGPPGVVSLPTLLVASAKSPRAPPVIR